MKNAAPVSTDEARRIAADLWTLVRAIESTDHRLAGHGIRTAQYAVLLGHALGWATHDLNDLCLAGLLHDIGRLTIPKTIREKNGPLTDEDYALIQSHPRAGAELLEPIPFLRQPAVWIAHHHERWDGCGYPYGLHGPLIPLGARILAVADTFDALLTDQPYRPAQRLPDAIQLIQLLAGSQLDPELVGIVVRLPLLEQPEWIRGAMDLPEVDCAATSPGGEGFCSSSPPRPASSRPGV
jgi:HD-GYP domain-containing protein (c-di-GMP phosphodiesterase class II)